MASAEHVKIVKKGSKAIAAWRVNNPERNMGVMAKRMMPDRGCTSEESLPGPEKRGTDGSMALDKRNRIPGTVDQHFG